VDVNEKEKNLILEIEQERNQILDNFNYYVNMDDFDPVTISRLVPYVDTPALRIIVIQNCPYLISFLEEPHN